MRKAVIYGFVLVAVSVLCFLNVTPIERRTLNPDDSIAPTAASTKPMPVQVTNFPPTQNVGGTVSVGNLPAVQQVAGTVAVGNLPIDANGHLLVAIQNPRSAALVLHSTSATYQGNLGGRTGATQKCQAEFPGSHFAAEDEIYGAHGTRGIVWLTSDVQFSWIDGSLNNAGTCYSWTRVTDPNQGTVLDGRTVAPNGFQTRDWSCDASIPITCAE